MFNSASEIHSLARACHAPMRGRPEKTRLVATKTENDDEHNGEARVVQKLAKKHRSNFENFGPRTQLAKLRERHGRGRDGL
jgi:hypothetical protein